MHRPFTAHNILLSDGSTTIPGQQLLCESEQCVAFLRTIKAFFPNRSPDTIHIVDLGCLEGGYSVEFARHGYNVIGIEVRDANIERCRAVAEDLNLPNLRFVQDDVRNVASYGEFDVAFCCGLLYHLDAPVSFLMNLGSVTRNLLILHTHFAPTGFVFPALPTGEREFFLKIFISIAIRTIYNRFLKLIKSSKHEFGLTALTSHEGKQGRWLYEFLPTTSEAKRANMLWSSHDNYRSFWLTKKDLIQTIRECGFNIIYEQYDFIDNITCNTYIEDNSRSLFVGIKLDNIANIL